MGGATTEFCLDCPGGGGLWAVGDETGRGVCGAWHGTSSSTFATAAALLLLLYLVGGRASGFIFIFISCD